MSQDTDRIRAKFIGWLLVLMSAIIMVILFYMSLH